jgi:hypothetical protein
MLGLKSTFGDDVRNRWRVSWAAISQQFSALTQTKRLHLTLKNPETSSTKTEGSIFLRQVRRCTNNVCRILGVLPSFSCIAAMTSAGLLAR